MLDILLPMPARFDVQAATQYESKAGYESTREKLRKQLRDGEMNERYVELGDKGEDASSRCNLKHRDGGP